MDTHLLAYASGLFDGEGSVMITAAANTRGVRYHRLQLSLTSTSMPVLAWLKEHFGGMITAHRAEQGNWRSSSRWQANSQDAEDFLESIYPWSIIKKAQIEIAFQLRETKLVKGAPGTNPMTADLYERREQLRMALKVLNNRGPVIA